MAYDQPQDILSTEREFWSWLQRVSDEFPTEPREPRSSTAAAPRRFTPPRRSEWLWRPEPVASAH